MSRYTATDYDIIILALYHFIELMIVNLNKLKRKIFDGVIMTSEAEHGVFFVRFLRGACIAAQQDMCCVIAAILGLI